MSNWIKEQFSLTGKRALVTGASKGIGAAIAISMAKAGADLILVGRTEESLAQTAKEVESAGRRATKVLCDLSLSDEISRAFSGVDSLEVDILVNNAGTIIRGSSLELPLSEWRRIMDTNLNSAFQLTQLCARSMVERGDGRVINIASLLSFQGGLNVSAYTTSKHGIAGLTKALGNEFGGRGVTINAIAPGYIETENTQALRDDPDRNKAISARIPMGRWGKPEDISSAAVFLASKAAGYINGEILTVDGGWMAR
jgi:2-dehydro-3-deoxy-D-gluconate 5-dehydrogenase